MLQKKARSKHIPKCVDTFVMNVNLTIMINSGENAFVCVILSSTNSALIYANSSNKFFEISKQFNESK